MRTGSPRWRSPDASGAREPSPISKSRLSRALAAGAIAIICNTLALWAADLVPLATARGGLLELLTRLLSAAAGAVGTRRLSAEVARAHPPWSAQIAFHVAVGLTMAVIYGLGLERRLPGPPWAKGLQCAVGVYLLNALVVLPATGQGLAGAAHLTPAGLIWFAAAHTLFFVLLAVAFARLPSEDCPLKG